MPFQTFMKFQAPTDDPPNMLTFEELVPVLDRCKNMASPNIQNTYRYLRMYGVMDSITKLRGLSN